jgi:hypothetical protein
MYSKQWLGHRGAAREFITTVQSGGAVSWRTALHQFSMYTSPARCFHGGAISRRNHGDGAQRCAPVHHRGPLPRCGRMLSGGWRISSVVHTIHGHRNSFTILHSRRFDRQADGTLTLSSSSPHASRLQCDVVSYWLGMNDSQSYTVMGSLNHLPGMISRLNREQIYTV